jgi:hypothetical protein
MRRVKAKVRRETLKIRRRREAYLALVSPISLLTKSRKVLALLRMHS